MKTYIFFLFQTLLITCTTVLASDEGPLKISYLEEELRTTEDFNQKLLIVKDIINNDVASTPDAHWFLIQKSIADSLNDDLAIIDAYSNLSMVYFNKDMKDSIDYWNNQTREVCSRLIMRDNNYFNSYYIEAMWFLRHKYYYEASQLIKFIKEEALEEDNVYAFSLSYRLSGIMCSQVKNQESSLIYFEKGLASLDSIPGMEVHALQFYISLLSESAGLPDKERYLDILQRFNDFISEKNFSEIPHNQRYKALWYKKYYQILHHIFYPNADSATFYFSQLQEIAEKNPTHNRINYEKLKARYYNLISSFDKAHDAIDYNIEKRRKSKDLYIRMKGDIYYKQGDYVNAFRQYDLANNNLIQSTGEIFSRELDLLEEKNEIGTLQSQADELKYKAYKRRLKGGCLIIIILTLICFIVIMMIRNEIKYRKLLSESTAELTAEKKELEAGKIGLEKMLDLAVESNMKKNNFLSTMNHEVRTPLNSIIGFSELIAADESTDGQVREFAEIVKSNSDLLLKLVGDVVDMSMLETGSVSVMLAKSDVVKCAGNVVKSMESLVSRGIKLSFRSCSDELMVDTDIFRVQQILTNMLGNAAKFTKAGEISLSIVNDDDKIDFIVTDTGCGVPAEMRDKIFQRFEKVNESAPGTGLGLSISCMLADKLGGRIYLDHRYSNGARFIFEHPLKNN